MDAYHEKLKGSLGLVKVTRFVSTAGVSIAIVASVACCVSNAPTLSYSRIEASYPPCQVTNITPNAPDEALRKRLQDYERTCHQKDIPADRISALLERHLYAVLRVQWDGAEERAVISQTHFQRLALFVQDLLAHDKGVPVILFAILKNDVLYVCYTPCAESTLQYEPNHWAESFEMPSTLCVDLRFHSGSTFGKKLFPIDEATIEKYADLWRELRSGS